MSIGMGVHIDQGHEYQQGSCNPALATAGPQCTLGSTDQYGFHCDCGKWVKDNPKMGAVSANPCSGWVIPGSSTQIAVPCTEQDGTGYMGALVQGCVCAGSQGNYEFRTNFAGSCGKKASVTFTTQATVF